MANQFKKFVVTFESVSGNITGNSILKQLAGYIDTESADVKVGKRSAAIGFVTTQTKEHILKICDEVKKSLEKATDGRLLYKLETISL